MDDVTIDSRHLPFLVARLDLRPCSDRSSRRARIANFPGYFFRGRVGNPERLAVRRTIQL